MADSLSVEMDVSSQKIGQERERIATVQLCFSTVFFGVSFIGQKAAMEEGIGPLTYTACRFLVSTILLLLFQPIANVIFHSQVDVADSTGTGSSPTRMFSELFKWAGLCGITSFGGSNLQQIGLNTVTAGKAAFITGMYVVFVPIVEFVLPGFGQQLNWRIWVSAGVSLLGMFFLSGGFTDADFWSAGDVLMSGEMIVFISMLFWVVSIISADVGTKRGVDGISFTIVEFSVSTVLSITMALIFEPESFQYPFHKITGAWKMILLVGFTEGISFLFATLGQMYTNPSKAALIFSLESVTAAFGAYLCLGEKLNYTELFGCFLMLAAAVLCTYQPNTESSDELTEIKSNDDVDNSNSDDDEIQLMSNTNVPIYKHWTNIPINYTPVLQSETECLKKV